MKRLSPLKLWVNLSLILTAIMYVAWLILGWGWLPAWILIGSLFILACGMFLFTAPIVAFYAFFWSYSVNEDNKASGFKVMDAKNKNSKFRMDIDKYIFTDNTGYIVGLVEKGEVKAGQSLRCYDRDGKHLYNFIITKITDKKRHRNMPSAKAGDSIRIHVRSNRTFSQNRMINKGSFVVR